MLSLLFITLFAIASLHGAFGAPSCHHGTTNVDTCASRCKHKLGWPGYTMGSDRWGSVAHKTNENVDGLTIKACNGSTPSSLLVAPSVTAGSNMPHNCSVTGAHATHTRNPSALSTSSTGSTVSPTPVGHLEGDVSNPPTTQPTPTSTPSVAPSSEPSPTPSSTGGSGDVSSTDIGNYLSAHNDVRSVHGAANLTWSAELSAYAQRWVNRCQFEHSTNNPYGENLAAGTGDQYTIKSAVQSWAAEVTSYNPNNPQFSHFTQMVWKATTQIGCAHQDCSGIFPGYIAHFHACEYNPAGNVEGEFSQNVQV